MDAKDVSTIIGKTNNASLTQEKWGCAKLGINMVGCWYDPTVLPVTGTYPESIWSLSIPLITKKQLNFDLLQNRVEPRGCLYTHVSSGHKVFEQQLHNLLGYHNEKCLVK